MATSQERCDFVLESPKVGSSLASKLFVLFFPFFSNKRRVYSLVTLECVFTFHFRCNTDSGLGALVFAVLPNQYIIYLAKIVGSA